MKAVLAPGGHDVLRTPTQFQQLICKVFPLECVPRCLIEGIPIGQPFTARHVYFSKNMGFGSLGILNVLVTAVVQTPDCIYTTTV